MLLDEEKKKESKLKKKRPGLKSKESMAKSLELRVNDNKNKGGAKETGCGRQGEIHVEWIGRLEFQSTLQGV